MIKRLSNEQLHTLRHMLGINTPNDKVPRPYRNYAAVSDDDGEFAELERIGAIEKFGRTACGTYVLYRCTADGKLAAMRSHRSIRKSNSARRYAKFLDLKDCLPDLTFREFLLNPDFESVRTEA